MSVEPREIEDIRSFPRLPWCDDDPWTNVRARSPVHHLCLGTNQMRNSIASAVFILAGGRNPFIRWPARKVADRAGQEIRHLKVRESTSLRCNTFTTEMVILVISPRIETPLNRRYLTHQGRVGTVIMRST